MFNEEYFERMVDQFFPLTLQIDRVILRVYTIEYLL